MLVEINNEIITKTDVVDYMVNRIKENTGIMVNTDLQELDEEWSLRSKVSTAFDIVKFQRDEGKSNVFMATEDMVIPVLIKKTNDVTLYANVPLNIKETVTMSMVTC